MTEEQYASVKVMMPDSLRAQFKAVCALEGISMNEMIVKLVENWLEEVRDKVFQRHHTNT